MVKRPGGTMIQSTIPTQSQLMPLMTKWEDLGKKSQLGPVIVTIVAFFLMSMFGDTSTITIKIDGSTPGTVVDPRHWIYTSNFLILVAVYLSLVSLYFIYRLVGKNKPWWVLLSASLFTAYFLWLFQVQHDFIWLYDFFHYSLAGGDPDTQLPFFQLFMRHFLGTGFFEEFVKALPLFILVILGNYMSPQLRAKYRGTAGRYLDRRGGGRRIRVHGDNRPICAAVSGVAVDEVLASAAAWGEARSAVERHEQVVSATGLPADQ